MNPTARRARATLAALERYHGPDDPRLPALRAQIAEAMLQEQIENAIDTLTQAAGLAEADRQRLALVLHPGGRDD